MKNDSTFWLIVGVIIVILIIILIYLYSRGTSNTPQKPLNISLTNRKLRTIPPGCQNISEIVQQELQGLVSGVPIIIPSSGPFSSSGPFILVPGTFKVDQSNTYVCKAEAVQESKILASEPPLITMNATGTYQNILPVTVGSGILPLPVVFSNLTIAGNLTVTATINNDSSLNVQQIKFNDVTFASTDNNPLSQQALSVANLFKATILSVVNNALSKQSIEISRNVTRSLVNKPKADLLSLNKFETNNRSVIGSLKNDTSVISKFAVSKPKIDMKTSSSKYRDVSAVDQFFQQEFNAAFTSPAFTNATFMVAPGAPPSSFSTGLYFGNTVSASTSNDVGSASAALNSITGFGNLNVTSIVTGAPTTTGTSIVQPITIQVTTTQSPTINTQVNAGFNPPLPGVTSYNQTPTFTISPPIFTINSTINGTFNGDGTITYNTNTFNVNSVSSNIDLTQLSNQIINLGAATSLFSSAFNGILSNLNTTANNAINSHLQSFLSSNLHFPSAGITTAGGPTWLTCSSSTVVSTSGACQQDVAGPVSIIPVANQQACSDHFCQHTRNPANGRYVAWLYNPSVGCIGYTSCTLTPGSSTVGTLSWTG